MASGERYIDPEEPLKAPDAISKKDFDRILAYCQSKVAGGEKDRATDKDKSPDQLWDIHRCLPFADKTGCKVFVDACEERLTTILDRHMRRTPEPTFSQSWFAMLAFDSYEHELDSAQKLYEKWFRTMVLCGVGTLSCPTIFTPNLVSLVLPALCVIAKEGRCVLPGRSVQPDDVFKRGFPERFVSEWTAHKNSLLGYGNCKTVTVGGSGFEATDGVFTRVESAASVWYKQTVSRNPVNHLLSHAVGVIALDNERPGGVWWLGLLNTSYLDGDSEEDLARSAVNYAAANDDLMKHMVKLYKNTHFPNQPPNHPPATGWRKGGELLDNGALSNRAARNPTIISTSMF